MVLLHVPRVLSTCLRGALQPSKMGATHIYRARVNALLDIDQFLHMNNASYLVHLELARWEMGVATGFATHLGRSGASFVVASAFTRFRKELKPLQPFDIHSTVHGADERSMWFLQLFHAAGADSPPVAAGLCRAVLRKGREVVSPRELLGRLGLSSAELDALAAAAPPPTPKPASQARAPATQVVAVSPVVSSQVPLPPRPPAGAAADLRVPATGNSARW